MSEEQEQQQDEKTEEPSQRKLTQAKEKGQVPVSREVLNWFFMLSSAVLVLVILPITYKNLTNTLKPLISSPHLFTVSEGSITHITKITLYQTLYHLALPLLLLLVTIISVNALQIRDGLSLKTFKPSMQKLSFMNGVKKIFSKNAIVEFLKLIVKSVVLFVVIYFLFSQHSADVQGWTFLTLMKAFNIGHSLLLKLFLLLLIILFFIAALDYMYQRFEFYKKLRMTKQEIKEEYKETEGDPLIKQRIRKIRGDRARSKMLQKIPNAAVIITNPTHYAVALSFNELTLEAPKLIAKGQDHLALLIRTIGVKHNIPIVENAAVARDFFARVPLDTYIPQDTYQAVAHIIRFVMKLKNNPF